MPGASTSNVDSYVSSLRRAAASAAAMTCPDISARPPARDQHGRHHAEHAERKRQQESERRRQEEAEKESKLQSDLEKARQAAAADRANLSSLKEHPGRRSGRPSTGGKKPRKTEKLKKGEAGLLTA